MGTRTDQLRCDKGALINELTVYGAEFKGTAVKCPFHDDKVPSGGIYADAGGVWRGGSGGAAGLVELAGGVMPCPRCSASAKSAAA